MLETDELSFPDLPKSELDLAIEDLVSRARQVQVTQGRLRALLKASQAVAEHLELPVVLTKIVQAAVELVGAEYGALGVISPSGGLEQFINVGMSEAQVAGIGKPPEGRGLLGAVIDDPIPIRLKHLSDDSRSGGFPANHPAMESFLGVPVRVRDEVYGNLYLSNSEAGEFSAEDEQLVGYLAATAGFAIDNARLFAETRRRQAWSAASAEVSASMVSAAPEEALTTLAEKVLALSDSDIVLVVVPSDDPADVVVSIARGIDHEVLEGRTFPRADTLADSVLAGGQPRLVNDGSGSSVALSEERTVGPVMALPLIGSGRPEGVLLVVRVEGRGYFSASDLEFAADFAGQASVALELASARVAQQRMALLEDRGRIARDLHDHVIQQLFGTGLELQSLASVIGDAAVADRVIHSVANLDVAIAQIRTAIFALTSSSANSRETVRHRLLDLAGDVTVGTAGTPSMTFSGPVDLIVTGTLADDVLAVAREAFTNAAKYAQATSFGLSLGVIASTVQLDVFDDGVGLSVATRRSGLANLEARALARGGEFTVDSSETGTRIRWSVPFPRAEE